MKHKYSIFLEKIWESFLSILPIFVIVLVLGLTVSPLSFSDFSTFIVSSILLIMGMFLFTSGAESSVLAIGQDIGGVLSKSRKLTLFIITSFVLGVIITIAEPDLMVLTNQAMQQNKLAFILAVGIGSGIFITISILRIIFQVKISTILFISYSIVIALMMFSNPNFIALAFDSSGVTTGPISTPFLLAFGFGISAVRSSKNSDKDSFGLIGVASVGPILFVLLLGLFTGGTTQMTQNTSVITESLNLGFNEIVKNFFDVFLGFMFDVGLVVLAILVIFIIFDIKLLKLPKTKIYKIIIGLLFTYLGAVIYLTGVTVGYLPISSIIGASLVGSGGLWIIIPLMIIIGFGIVVAEPAVHVLNKKVYELTGGLIKPKVMFISISISVAVAMIVAVLKIYFNISFVYIMLPLYLLIVIFTLITPQIFVAIAYDSGGVASGPMSTSFLLPLALGIASGLGIGDLNVALGTIAVVSSFPLLTIQVLGTVFRIIKYYKNKQLNQTQKTKKIKVEIISFGE